VDSQDPVAIAAVQAIRAGGTASLASLLSQHPGLVSEQIHDTRTPRHVVADWPGYLSRRSGYRPAGRLLRTVAQPPPAPRVA
jgi:hypothetical protein